MKCTKQKEINSLKTLNNFKNKYLFFMYFNIVIVKFPFFVKYNETLIETQFVIKNAI